jgi:hypothetical protein
VRQQGEGAHYVLDNMNKMLRNCLKIKSVF